jgi:hypothetical protein
MNRTIKDATVKAFHQPNLESLRAHVLAFVCAFNFAKHLKGLRWKTPYQTIVETWQKTPAIFEADPRHFIPGPYTLYSYLAVFVAWYVVFQKGAGQPLPNSLFTGGQG